MINLLPEPEKKAILRTYHLRVLVVAVYLLAGAVCIAALFLLPAYVLSQAKENAVEVKLENTKAHIGDGTTDSLDTIIQDINAKLKIFPDTEATFQFSEDGIGPILNHKNSQVHIMSLSYAKKPDNTIGIAITGTAENRESLLQFQDALSQEPNFVGVALPISNFIKGSNIEFTIEFTVKQ